MCANEREKKSNYCNLSTRDFSCLSRTGALLQHVSHKNDRINLIINYRIRSGAIGLSLRGKFPSRRRVRKQNKVIINTCDRKCICRTISCSISAGHIDVALQPSILILSHADSRDSHQSRLVSVSCSFVSWYARCSTCRELVLK